MHYREGLFCLDGISDIHTIHMIHCNMFESLLQYLTLHFIKQIIKDHQLCISDKRWLSHANYWYWSYRFRYNPRYQTHGAHITFIWNWPSSGFNAMLSENRHQSSRGTSKYFSWQTRSIINDIPRQGINVLIFANIDHICTYRNGKKRNNHIQEYKIYLNARVQRIDKINSKVAGVLALNATAFSWHTDSQLKLSSRIII